MEPLLIVEDDLALGEGVRLALRSEERPVTLCRDLAQACLLYTSPSPRD